MPNEQELLTKLIETEERSKSNMHRLNHMEKEYGALNQSINRMATAVEVLANEQRHSADEQRKMRETISETNHKVVNLEIAPAKSSKKIKNEIIKQTVATMAGTLVGALLTLILK
jgi:predicted nuclease with TOPRIM domain